MSELNRLVHGQSGVGRECSVGLALHSSGEVVLDAPDDDARVRDQVDLNGSEAMESSNDVTVGL